MAGRLGEGTHHELRIHGVSGTPPEGMLDDLGLTSPAPDPCGQPPPGTLLTIWRRLPHPPGVRAYSWGSVTSGSARSALYLLLVPYLLVNLAGWAALPSQVPGSAALTGEGRERPWGVRTVTAGVRLLALLLTVILAQWAVLVAVDLVAYQWGIGVRGLPTWALGVGVLAAAATMEVVLLVTRLRLRRPADDDRTPRATSDRATPGVLTDPVGHTWLTHDQGLLWSSPATIAHQRRAHGAVALASIALVSAGMIEGWTAMPVAAVGVGRSLGTVALVAGIGVVVQHSLSSGRPGRTLWLLVGRIVPWVGWASVLAVAVAALGTDLPAGAAQARAVTPEMVEGLRPAVLTGIAAAGRPVFLPVARGVGIGLTVAYTTLCVLVALLAWTTRLRSGTAGPGRRARAGQAANLPGLALLGGAVGAGIGAAVAAAVSRLLSGPDVVILPGPMPEALALSFAGLAVTLGWVLVVGLGRHVLTPVPGGWRVRLTTAVHRLLERGSWIGWALTVLGTAGTALVVVLSSNPDNPLHVLEGRDPLAQLIVLVAAALVATAVGLLLALRLEAALGTGRAGHRAGSLRWNRVVGVLVGLLLLAVATVVVARLPGDEVARQLRPAALAIGLLTPGGFVLGKGLSALRSPTDRRTIAILWDVGTFFPRWFHPLSPPSYGDQVVTDVCELVAAELAPAGGHRRTLLLAPHSQGTVIGAAAVLGLPPDVDTSGLGLLTYGSPLRHLYAEFFPRLFDDAAFAALHERLGGRWRNLARTSDPIGAPVGVEDVDRVLGDPCGRGHSGYPREPEYAAAVGDIQQAMRVELRIPEADGSARTDPRP